MNHTNFGTIYNQTIQGDFNTGTAVGCTIIGKHNNIKCTNCRIIGNHNTITGDLNTANGNHNTLKGYGNSATGKHNNVIVLVTSNTLSAWNQEPINPPSQVFRNNNGVSMWDNTAQHQTNFFHGDLVEQPQPQPIRNPLADIRQIKAAEVKDSLKLPDPISDEKDNVDGIPDQFICAVCTERLKKTVCLPCGHSFFCVTCAIIYGKTKSKCPVCNEKITEIKRQYL